MRSTWAAVATLAVALWGMTPGKVSAEPMEDDNNLTIGVGIICNTPEQMQRLIGLRIGGAEVAYAVRAVNTEAKNPRACGIAAVAFTSDKMVDMKSVQGRLVQIMRISVLAAFDGQHWSRIPVMTQYALIEPNGYAI